MLKFFMDEHQLEFDSFPKGHITDAEFVEVYKGFEKACEEEGVVPMGSHVNCHHGRAYCLIAAPNEEAVRRAHEKVGLPYNKITEIKRLTSLDLLLK
jgi:Protein of unknown function (DUF4242)